MGSVAEVSGQAPLVVPVEVATGSDHAGKPTPSGLEGPSGEVRHRLFDAPPGAERRTGPSVIGEVGEVCGESPSFGVDRGPGLLAGHLARHVVSPFCVARQ